MNTFDQPLVGSIALLTATVAAIIGVGPWDGPYRLQTFETIDRRYGRRAARLVWIAIALVLMTLGLFIISGWRPAYVSGKSPHFGVPHKSEKQVPKNSKSVMGIQLGSS